MEQITATPPIIIVERARATSGTTTIEYSKLEHQELWERTYSGSWSLINVHRRTGLGNEADFKGSYPVGLTPGDHYEVVISEVNHGPLSTEPIFKKALKVFCLWKKPEFQNLIVDEGGSTGGTWHSRTVDTNVLTNIVIIGVSRKPPRIDSDGIPHFQESDGEPTAPLTTSTRHQVEIKPLVPGNRYFFAVVVADTLGNWQVMQAEFTTLRRKFTVEFTKLHIYNDGDPMASSLAGFRFSIHRGGSRDAQHLIQEFNLPLLQIDDWGKTDRPYDLGHLGFAYVGSLEIVNPDNPVIRVWSRGVEYDGSLENDETAETEWRTGGLPFPDGQFVETVTNNLFRMNCPPSVGDFHYGVDVRWSVEYGA